jgi:hypothetical protein
MKGQLQRLGISYAWEREIATCLPDYYKFNQWIFLKMLERGLAYRKRSTVNWCPVDNTVLANEQVIDGACWRCGSIVEPRDLEQWFFKITEYADELLTGLDTLTAWPEKVVVMQRNWIGRSEGAYVKFALADAPPVESGSSRTDHVEVFTTRIDTIYGANFIMLAPEHPLVERFAAASSDPAVFRAKAQAFRSQERDVRMGGKQGFDTGRRAINPFTGKQVPIWVANFVLWGYGTGAVMGVPGHDERDFEFAKTYHLPITVVVQKEGEPLSADTMTEAHAGEGSLVNSGDYNGLPWEEANRRMTVDAKARGFGEGTVQYRLKDWGISRQRYWGTPIPMLYCEKDGVVPVLPGLIRTKGHLGALDALDEGDVGAVRRARDPRGHVIDLTQKVHDEARAGLFVDLLGRAVLGDPPGVHHEHAVGQDHGLFLIVGDEERRDADPSLQFLQLEAHLLPQPGIEVGEGLVEEQHVRVRHERAPQRHALLLPARHLGRLATLEPDQVDQRHRVADPFVDVALVDLLAAQAEGDVLVHVEVREQGVGLEHGVHVPLVRGQCRHVAAAEVDGAVRGLLEAADHPQGRGLPAARRPEHREELALLDIEREVVDRGRVPEELRDPVEAHVDLRHVHPLP